MLAPSDFAPQPTDSPVVARLKQAALDLLASLPPDLDLVTTCQRADLFSALALRIRPKETEGGMAPFVFNPIQMDHLASLRKSYRVRPRVDAFRGIRDVILKPRQLGFTTYIAALFFIDGLLNPGRNCLVLTHLDKVSQKVLAIYRAFYDSLPDDVKAGTRLRRASALHLELDFLDADGTVDPVNRPSSSFMVHTAAGLDLRGVTVHNLHCSEAAFYENWAELVRGIFQAVPSTGNIILESTANGFNHYKDIVDGALSGQSRWRLVFYPWFAHPEYAIPLSREEAARLEASLDPEERLLVVESRVSLPQIQWRRMKISEMGGFLDSFRQEYPATISDAFISSGRPRFDLATVARNLELAKGARPLYQLEEGVDVYVEPDPDDVYILCADPAEGIDKGEGDPAAEIGGHDYSAGSVISARTLRTMATIHGRWEPAEFARKLARLGAMYDALLCVERNNHGHTVLFALEEAGYPRLYRHLEYDAAGQSFLKLGFPTTPATKTLVVDALAEVIRRDALPACEWRFWAEALVFVRDPAGKCGAMPGRHDDRVMSKAIGVYIVTLGAKAWGGVGVMGNADGANLPLGRLAATAAAAGQSYPAPLPAAQFPPMASPAAPQEPVSPLPAPAMPSGVLPGLLGATALHGGGNSVDLQALQRLRADAPPEEQAPCCGSCVSLAGLPNCPGQFRCSAQGFIVREADPACHLWEPASDGYNGGIPAPWPVNIGGMP